MTSDRIVVGPDGWPVYQFKRPLWPHRKCDVCHDFNAMTLVPFDTLGPSWWRRFPQISLDSLMGFCTECYKLTRSERLIMGYKTVKGKTRQYVQEDLFGGEQESVA